MNYWLIKSEPSVFSIDDMKNNHQEPWNGVRNYQARNNMKDMKLNDICFFYHSNTKHAGIVGLVKIIKEYYEDKEDKRFGLVDVEYIKHTPYLALADLKKIEGIEYLALFHQSRLSVQPVDEKAADILLMILDNVKKLSISD
ncbi:MAG: EVE domain-containing protein [Proteobacteria bacterium]|nr:EVE domain-containing protein [Pseudomonadota bacterium]